MTYKEPGKSFRNEISTGHFVKMFPDNKAAEEWFIKKRWPEEVCCPRCGSVNVQTGAKHKTMPFRCRDCRRRFSTKIGTFMEASNLGYRDWLYTIYLTTTNLTSVSSMKLRRELDISEKSAWFMAHRIRQAFNLEPEEDRFEGPVEVDETYMGGKRRNMPEAKRAKLEGCGSVGKSAVVGMKDRKTNRVSAEVVEDTTAKTLQGFVHDRIEPDAQVYTDDLSPYASLDNHDSVRHSHLEYVKGDCHTNGVESFWSMLQPAHMGTFHRLSGQHLHRYVGEFARRHNMRNLDTLDQMALIVDRMNGTRLRYKDLAG